MTIRAPLRRENRAARTGPAARPAAGPARNWRDSLFRRAVTGVVIALALVWLVPVAGTLDTSIKPENATILIPATWRCPTQRSRPTAPTSRPPTSALVPNSAIVTIAVTALTVITASMAGYALSRGTFRGSACCSHSSWPGS